MMLDARCRYSVCSACKLTLNLLFTCVGPLYAVYNRILRAILSTDPADAEENLFSTTIWLIVSGILKLSSIAKMPDDGMECSLSLSLSLSLALRLSLSLSLSLSLWLSGSLALWLSVSLHLRAKSVYTSTGSGLRGHSSGPRRRS